MSNRVCVCARRAQKPHISRQTLAKQQNCRLSTCRPQTARTLAELKWFFGGDPRPQSLDKLRIITLDMYIVFRHKLELASPVGDFRPEHSTAQQNGMGRRNGCGTAVTRGRNRYGRPGYKHTKHEPNVHVHDGPSAPSHKKLASHILRCCGLHSTRMARPRRR